jgi:sugar phosphate permease
VVVTLCFLLGLVNYMDRVIISYAIKPIQETFSLDNTEFGLVVSMFAFGTVVVNGLSGWLLDRGSVRLIWAICLFLWSVMMILLGMAQVLVIFLILRFGLGVFEGVNFPAMGRSMADWMSGKELSRMTAISLLGVPLAMLIGGPVLSHLIDTIGWRSSFMCLGGVGMLLGLAWVILYRNGPKHPTHGAKPSTSRAVHKDRWWHLMKDPTLLATSWSFFAFGYVLWFAISWIPGYLEQTYDMHLQQVGWFSSLPWIIAVILMPIAGGLSDRIIAKTGSIRKARIHIIWICHLIACAFFVPLLFEQTPTMAIICLSLAIGFSMAPNSPYYSICADLHPKRAGAATGIMVTFFSVSGIVSPVLTGWLSDLFDGFAAAFGALVVIVLTAVLGMLFFARAKPTEELRVA